MMENQKHENLFVMSEVLLYKIADLGYLHKLCEVKPSDKNPKKRVYFFEYDEMIEKAIKDYQIERQKEKEKIEKAKIESVENREPVKTVTLSKEDRLSIIEEILHMLGESK